MRETIDEEKVDGIKKPTRTGIVDEVFLVLSQRKDIGGMNE